MGWWGSELTPEVSPCFEGALRRLASKVHGKGLLRCSLLGLSWSFGLALHRALDNVSRRVSLEDAPRAELVVRVTSPWTPRPCWGPSGLGHLWAQIRTKRPWMLLGASMRSMRFPRALVATTYIHYDSFALARRTANLAFVLASPTREQKTLDRTSSLSTNPWP